MSVYEEIGLKRVINASGRMTFLGVSTISDETAEFAKQGGQNYVVIDDLFDRAGEIVSQYTGAEDSCVTSCASAAIVLSIAGIITKGRIDLVQRLPESDGLKNEIIIQKGHAVDYGAPMTTMIRLAGGVPKEVGYSNLVEKEHIENAINDKTAALMYVKSHHCVQKGMVSLEDMVEIAHRHNLPILVDAAAEEDLKKYVKTGADLVVYSGAKAIEATTSGFVTGKKQYISYAKKQYKGIGRAMKVGKESIMGLLKALELYTNKDEKKQVERQKSIVNYLKDEINKIDGLECKIIKDEAGREIYRAEVKVDEAALGMNAEHVAEELSSGNPIIYGRNHKVNLGFMSFDPRPMLEGDKEIIVKRLKEIINI